LFLYRGRLVPVEFFDARDDLGSEPQLGKWHAFFSSVSLNTPSMQEHRPAVEN
jgi:hypothetical protein